jgi:hypothetical protein
MLPFLQFLEEQTLQVQTVFLRQALKMLRTQAIALGTNAGASSAAGDEVDNAVAGCGPD